MPCRSLWLTLVFLLDGVAYFLGSDTGGEAFSLLLGRLLGVNLLVLLSIRLALGRWPQLCGLATDAEQEEAEGEDVENASRQNEGDVEAQAATTAAAAEGGSAAADGGQGSAGNSGSAGGAPAAAIAGNSSRDSAAAAAASAASEATSREAAGGEDTSTSQDAAKAARPQARSTLLLEEDSDISARTAPLLGAEDCGCVCQPEVSPPTLTRNVTDGDERARRIDRTMEQQRELLAKLQKGNVARNYLLGICYAYINFCSMRTAILAIRQEQLMAIGTLMKIAGILVMNAEFILLKGLVFDITSGRPVQMPGMHNHLLYWTDVEGRGYVVCSVCNTKVGEKTGGFLVLQCRVCVPGNYGFGGFQVCSQCYRKQAVKAKEQGASDASGIGILRSDKGPQPPTPLTVVTYVTRLGQAMRKDALVIVLLSVSAVQFLNAYIPKAQGDCITALVHSSADEFDRLIKRFFFLVIGSSLLSFAMSTAISTLQTRLWSDMSIRLFKSLMSQDIAFYDNAQVGQLTSRLSNDLGQAVSPVSVIVNSFLANIIMLVVGFFICMQSSWKLTVLAFTFLGPMIHISAEFSKWSMRLMASQYTFSADATGVATQALTNIRTVRCFGAQSIELAKYNKYMSKVMSIGIKSAWGQGFANLLGGLVQQGASFIILYYGGHLALQHQDNFDVGAIITFTYLWNRLSSAFSGLNDNLNQPVKAMSAGQRLFEVLDLKADIQEQSGQVLSRGQAEIEFQDVEFTYQSRPDQKVLKGISFKIQAGQTTAIVGKSGCGKSTLTKLILRFYDPQAGSILINGKDLRELHILEFRQLVGVVSQDTQLFRTTVAENISYGLDECTHQDVERAAKQANADEFIRKLPEGYKTMCGEGGHDFSGGQRQRLSIARALVRRPALLLLDEATSALDAENEATVQEALDVLMQEMQGQCTIIVIAHRLSTVKDSSQIVVLQEGQVVEVGSHDQLLQIKGGRYAELVERQLAGVQDDTKADKAKDAEAAMKKLLDEVPAEKQMDILKKLMTSYTKGKGRG